MTALRYKEYQGFAEIADGKILLKILHIEDTVLGECNKASEVQKTFEALVDDYLETCEEVGKVPSKPFKGSFNVRVSSSLHRAIAMCAVDNNETMNAWVEKALLEMVEKTRSIKRFRGTAFFMRSLGRQWHSETPSPRPHPRTVNPRSYQRNH